MTDAEWAQAWLAENVDFDFLLDFLDGTVDSGERKLRLFGCACARSIWHLLTDEGCRNAIEIAESFADGETPRAVLRKTHLIMERRSRRAWDRRIEVDAKAAPGIERKEAAITSDVHNLAREVTRDPFTRDVEAKDARDAAMSLVMHSAIPADSWASVAGDPAGADGDRAAEDAIDAERPRQVRLFRCIIGNPFQPVALEPSWRTNHVVTIARMVSDRRQFDDLPILADALEEAGCTNSDVIKHCREPAGHALGCWCLDLILGKE